MRLFQIVMLFVFANAAFGQSVKSKPAATINGEIIGLEEVDAILKQRPPSLTPLVAAQHRQQRLEVLTSMIDDLLIRQFLNQQGPKIENAEIDKTFAALEAAQKMQGKTIAEYLKETNQTEAQVRANIRTMLQMAKYVKDHTSEDMLRKYHEANRDFFDKTTVRVSHIVVRTGQSASAEERRRARTRLETLKSELAAGKLDFGTAAKLHSECPSATKGGDVGFIFRKWQVDEAFARAAFALKNVGDISDIVESDFGLHLIKLTERKPGTTSKFDTCIEDVRDSYTEELRQTLLAKIREKSKIEITLP